MKRLYLLRHAKSGWDQPNLADHDRTLAPRGIAAGELLASAMAREKWLPQAVLCSTAVRTRQTLDLLKTALPAATEIAFLPALYQQMSRDYLDIIRGVGNEPPSLMLVGHNSATEHTALSLAGETDTVLAAYPTAGLAVFDLSIDTWAQTSPRRGTLIAFWVPRRGRIF